MTHKEYIKQAEELYGLIEKIHEKKMHFWADNVLFTWQWWIGVSLTVGPWVLWLIFRKKESTYRLLLAGFFSMVISSWLDFVGVALGLWHYNYDVLPLIPSYLPWDFALIPISIMFLIQFKPHSNPYIKAAIFSAGSAFIGEPFFTWIKSYDPDQWKYIYSFPILFLIYLLAHFLTTRNELHKL